MAVSTCHVLVSMAKTNQKPENWSGKSDKGLGLIPAPPLFLEAKAPSGHTYATSLAYDG